MRKALALLLLLACALAFGQGEPVPQPAKNALDAFLDAFNSGELTRANAFDAAWRPPTPVAQMEEFRRLTGGFTLLRVEKTEPLSVSALLEEKNSDTIARLRVDLMADEPTRIASMPFSVIPRPADLAIPRMTEAAAIAALSKRAEDAAKDDLFSGAVLVARDGRILLERAWGMADRARPVIATADTKFRLGSMNKMFTAVAILQLAEAGKVALADPVAKYLPDYPNQELAAKVTVRDLLTHTGGTGDIFGPAFMQNRATLKEHADYVRLFGARAQEGGGSFRYSNYGYILLGAIIEKASAVSYYEYVQKNIFAPAGMTATGSIPESVPVPNRARGYMRRQGQWVSNAQTLPWRGTAAGGGYSTVGDLFRFTTALSSGKLISKSMLAEATRGQVTPPVYGYGFFLQGEGSLAHYGHSGGAPGMNGELRVYPKLGYVVVALSNLDPPSATRLADFIEARIPLGDAKIGP
jgi:CubicO group peptidase (beta-lactamase class C family)